MNVGDKVSDNRMALQLLKGLSDEYKSFRTSVRHLKPLPSFDELRSILELEEQSNASNLLTEVHEEVATPTGWWQEVWKRKTQLRQGQRQCRRSQ
ncbi:Adenylate kinase isoenzyme 6 [Bienertia sinuspersici]